ncbi:MAG: glycosyltransferase [Oribacterium sp.]|nr:glycosyltransferase [Oribacterium sp.]
MATVSVVMTTYNGERFIIDQLDSIRNQTMKPDEVLIFDDRSTDKTFSIIDDYIKKYALHTWKVIENAENLGWKKNFINAMKNASGDYVFLSDQDDIWMHDKIEDMTSIMMKQEKIMMLAANCEIIYSQDVASKKYPPFYSIKRKSFYLDSIWNNKGVVSWINSRLKEKKNDSGQVKKIEFDTGLFSVQRQGCVMCMRRELITDALKYWNEECPHDTVIWFYAAAHDGLYLYEKKVIKYRHHSSNAGFEDTLGYGLNASSEKKKIKSLSKQIKSLLPILDDVVDANEKKNICRLICEYLQLRYRFLEKKQIVDGIKIIKQKGNVGKRQVIFDWLLTYMT